MTEGELEHYNEGGTPSPAPVFEGWNGQQLQQAKDLAVEMMRAYLADVSPVQWHERVDPMGTETFLRETRRFNPEYLLAREVTGVEGVQKTDN